MVTVSDVEVSNDLVVKVFVSILGDERQAKHQRVEKDGGLLPQHRQEGVAALDAGDRLCDSLERGQKVSNLLDDLRSERG